MRPKSVEAIKRMALSHGAVINIDGRKLNAGRSVVATVAQKRPDAVEMSAAYMPAETRAEPEPTVKPDSGIFETASAIDRYASATFLMSENTALLLQDVKKILDDVAKPAPEQQRPIKWVFTVKRDMRGLMEQIVATPVFD